MTSQALSTTNSTGSCGWTTDLLSLSELKISDKKMSSSRVDINSWSNRSVSKLNFITDEVRIYEVDEWEERKCGNTCGDKRNMDRGLEQWHVADKVARDFISCCSDHQFLMYLSDWRRRSSKSNNKNRKTDSYKFEEEEENGISVWPCVEHLLPEETTSEDVKHEGIPKP